MEIQADVIIVGAGPAGAIAAYQLASLGVSALILEKSVFPRYKVCGGGLTHKILDEIPFDVSPVFEAQINSVQFSCKFKEVFVRHSDTPMMYSTMRSRLDALMLENAIKAGARVIFEEKVREVVQDSHGVLVITKKQQFRSKLIIGAEGATGIVARAGGLRKNILPGLAWEAEIPVDPETVKRFSNTIFLDWGTFPGGYGWVFPKKEHLSVGVGGPASLSGGMMPYYHRFLDYLSDSGCRIRPMKTPMESKEEITDSYPYSLKSWPIPVRIKKSKFHNNRILITGDAAGLTDPLTGEGIYYAVRSGKLAADACHDYLDSKMNSIQSYSENVNDELMTELMEANKIKNLFNAVPLKIHHFVRDNNRAWNAFGKVLKGERRYADVRMGFGRLKFLWNTACLISKWIFFLKEKGYRKNG